MDYLPTSNRPPVRTLSDEAGRHEWVSPALAAKANLPTEWSGSGQMVQKPPGGSRSNVEMLIIRMQENACVSHTTL